jgi:hypothetical protein
LEQAIGKKLHHIGILLNFALANKGVFIGVVGPSWRQTKLVIRRIGDFAHRLPAGSKIVVQKTRITCPNGSVIEAFPNNPDTIRGPTLHVVYADEFNFIPNAEDLYDAALFTLGTTNGKFICKYLKISPKIKDKNKDYRGRFFTQKTVFLAKALGMNLSYSFTPYVAGPYSRDLACDYYANTDKVESLNSGYELSNQEIEILDKIKSCSGIYDSMHGSNSHHRIS